MLRRVAAHVLGITLAAGCSSSPADAAPAGKKDLSALLFVPSSEELHKGNIVYGPDDTAYMLVRAPARECWRRLSNVGGWLTIFSDLDSLRPVGGGSRSDTYAFVAKSPIGKKRYTLVFSRPAPNHLDFKLDKTQPADVKDATGAWELRETDGGSATIVVYRANFDVGVWVPGFLRKKMVESVLGDFRGYMERHPGVGESAASPAR
jgi:hypothetical protein